MGKFIDFAYIKQHADFAAVLAHYRIDSKGSGDELRCCCPFHDDENPSMSVNTSKNVFTCHAASCGEQGNILEFVAGMEGADDLRAAAETLAGICKIELAPPKAAKAKSDGKRRAGQRQDRKGRSVPEKRRTARQPKADDEAKAAAASVTGQKPKPLGFALELDPAHEYGQERQLSEWTISEFGMGYCGRGTMRGRWCIPIHNEDGEIVAYTGRWPGDDLPEDEPRWKLPKDFDKSQVLFNLHRVLKAGARYVVLVEGIFDAARLWTEGVPVVALLGSSISEAQVALLQGFSFQKAFVVLDGGAGKAQATVVERVARDMPARSLVLPDGTDPASVEYAWLERYMPGLSRERAVA